jgi:uncharacterized protein YjdB
MKQVKKTIQKKFMLWLMIVVVMTGTVTTGYVETVQAETTIYVTRTGSKYHTHKCGNGTYYASTRSAALARGLTPCQKCFPNGDSSRIASSSSSKTTAQKTVKTMKLNKSSLEMVIGQTKTLKVSNAPGTVKWSSSNSSVALVTSKGKVTAKSKGKATITVKSGSQKKQCKVTVKQPKITSIQIGEYLTEMETNDSQEVEITTKPFSALDYYEVSVISSDPSIVWAEVEEDGDEGCFIELESEDLAGTVTITVSVGGKTASFKVTVMDDDLDDDIDDGIDEEEY